MGIFKPLREKEKKKGSATTKTCAIPGTWYTVNNTYTGRTVVNSSPLYCTEYVIHTGCGRGAVRVATVPGGICTRYPVPYTRYRTVCTGVPGPYNFKHTQKKSSELGEAQKFKVFFY